MLRGLGIVKAANDFKGRSETGSPAGETTSEGKEEALTQINQGEKMGMPIYADYAFDALNGPVAHAIIKTVVIFGLANLANLGLEKMNVDQSVRITAIGGITVLALAVAFWN